MTIAVRSTLDVAFWFVDRADSLGAELSDRKLQALLYLAQLEYAAAHEGRKLMPATFLAAESGPFEPTIYHIFQEGRPRLVTALPPPRVDAFLADMWRRFGALGDEALGTMAREDSYYRRAFAVERLAEIVFPVAMPKTGAKSPPGGERSVRTTDGRVATKWTPGAYNKKLGNS